jgi:hypothetical protein
MSSAGFPFYVGEPRRCCMAETRDETGNVVGVDPHRQTLTAAVLDERGGELGTEHFTADAAGF